MTKPDNKYILSLSLPIEYKDKIEQTRRKLGERSIAKLIQTLIDLSIED